MIVLRLKRKSMIIKPGKIKLVLSTIEIRSLLSLMFRFDPQWIVDRNSRLMVSELLGKLIIKFSSIAEGANKEHKISITQAQAAAFDLAFRETPIPVNEGHPFFGTGYEENVIMRVLDMINRVLV